MIDKLNTHYSFENPASVYDEEALTALELAGRQGAKINEVVDAQNKLRQDTEEHLEAQDATIDQRMDTQDKRIATMNDTTMPAKVTSEVKRQIDNGTFAEQIDTSLNHLNERVNNLLGSVTEGTSTLDAEVIDIRVGGNGVTYETAGESVRGQYASLMQELSPLYYDIDWIDGGYLVKDGTITQNELYAYTDFIKLPSHLVQFGVYMGYSACCIIYNKFKRVIQVVSYADKQSQGYGEYRFTSGDACYIRLSCTKAELSNAFLKVYSLWGDNPVPHNTIHTNHLKDGSVNPQKTTFLVHDDTTNLIDRNNLMRDKYINGEDIQTYPQAGFYSTGYIPLKPNTSYEWGNIYSGHYVFYDAEFNVLEHLGTANVENQLSNPFVTPDGCAYGTFTCINETQANKCWIGSNSECRYHLIGVNPLDGSVEYDDFSVFNKCACIGDSLMEGTFNYYTQDNTDDQYMVDKRYSTPTYLQKLTGVECVNLGVGGMSSAEWFNRYRNTDLSGYDVAIIQLGVNDIYRYNGWTDTSITAFNNIVDKLQEENPHIKIFVSTIIPATAYKSELADEVSEGIRAWIKDRADADVYLVDLALTGHVGDSEGYNAGHLSAYGYLRLAKDWKNHIGVIMQDHKGEFRLVQFISDTEGKYY